MKFVYGIGVILLMIFMPMGLAGMANMVLKRTIDPKKKAAPAGGGAPR